MTAIVATKRHTAPVVHSDGLVTPKGWYRFAGHDDGVCDIEFGPGTVEAAKALTACYAVWKSKMPAQIPVRLVCDVAAVDRAPLRVRLIVGRWLFGERGRISRLAVSGAGLFQQSIVAAVLKIARIERIQFFMQRDDAVDWIAAPEEGE